MEINGCSTADLANCVGDAMAERIASYRPFQSLEELLEVVGQTSK